MRKILTTAILAALTVFSVGPVAAQTLHRSFELSAIGGVRVYDDDIVFLDSGWVVGGKAAWFPHANIGVEGTISYSEADPVSSTGDDDLDDEIEETFGDGAFNVTEVRVDAVYQMLFSAEQSVVPYFSAGVGQFVFDVSDESAAETLNEPETTFNYGGGLKIFFGNRFALRLDARDNVFNPELPFASATPPPTNDTKTFQANNPEFQVGVTIGFGGSDEGFGVRDTDLDGVPDKDDLCPNTPRGVIVDETGCPVDSDNDGVPDGLDACPNTPEGAQVDERGCPLDSDNDGVYDGIDQCPNTPAGVQVDETGCPLEVEEEEEACLQNQDWYTGDATINVNAANWVKFGSTQTVAMDQLSQIGEYRGVPVYARSDANQPYREVLLPLCSPENSYQPYRRESAVRGTTGFIRN